jgi:hypothetical protein
VCEASRELERHLESELHQYAEDASHRRFIKPISFSINAFLTKMESASKQHTAYGSNETARNWLRMH